MIAIIGPAFSGESQAVVGDKFCDASPAIPTITASASNATLQDQGFKCWHRVMPNDNVEGARVLTGWPAGAKKVYVIDDLSAYGKGVADTVRAELKAKGVTVVLEGRRRHDHHELRRRSHRRSSGSGADALFYGGYDAQAALLAKALKAAGFKGRR